MIKESKLVIARNFNCSNKIIDYGVGTPVNVEFDFEAMWKYVKENRLKKGFIGLDFYHTHPEGMLKYSELDRQMFKGYTLALGKQFICTFIIVCFKNSDVNDISSNWIGHYYNSKYDRVETFDEDESYYFGIDETILKLLKIASYGVQFDNSNGRPGKGFPGPEYQTEGWRVK